MARLPPETLSAKRWERLVFARPTLQVARGLLGQRLVHVLDGERLSGIISETEAYISERDLACHARFGRTSRSEVMFGPPGHAYVYFTYGMHWMFNVVTEAEGFPAAVLIRAIQPQAGVETMRARRGRPDRILTDGPGKLAQALGIDRRLNGHDLCAPDAVLFVERARAVPTREVVRGPRVGLNNTPEPWKSKLWNFKWMGDREARR
ncbi:MAG: DNA-3-methyladenine glycosylase [Anaerolineales bacterium]